MNLSQHYRHLLGSHECPCIQTNQLDPLQCEKTDNKTFKLGPGLPQIPCVPKDYGATCKQHHPSYFPECSESTENSPTPSWCNFHWCFVDADMCFLSNIEYRKFPLGYDDLYTSFQTCGNFSKYWTSSDWKDREAIEINFHAAFPDYEYPYHFIEEEDGKIIEYTNGKSYSGNGIMRGVIIDYLKELELRTNIKHVNLVLPSGGSRAKYPETAYTAAINDVRNHVVDLAIGVYWMTSKRLGMTHFTVPLFESPVYLYESDKKTSGSFWFNIKKTFSPFSPGLCICLAGLIITVGLLNIYISNQRGERATWYEALTNRHFKQSLKMRRVIIIVQVIFDSLIQSFVQCFGQANHIDKPSTFAHKILATGFGFFILIFTASYTANLATFLTVKHIGDLITSMDIAIERGVKICAPAGLKSLLENQYEADMFIYVEGLPYLKQAIEYMEKDRCSAIAAEHSEMTTMIDNICQYGLVSIQTLVTDVPIGFSIQTKYARSFSRAMYQLEYDGIDFLQLLKHYNKPLLECSLYPNEDGSLENEKLVMQNMMFPITVMTICAVIASFMKLTNGRKPSLFSGFRKKLGSTVEDENHRSINYCTDKDSDELSKNLDLLEYKYRLEILTHRMDYIKQQISQQTGVIDEGTYGDYKFSFCN